MATTSSPLGRIIRGQKQDCSFSSSGLTATHSGLSVQQKKAGLESSVFRMRSMSVRSLFRLKFSPRPPTSNNSSPGR